MAANIGCFHCYVCVIVHFSECKVLKIMFGWMDFWEIWICLLSGPNSYHNSSLLITPKRQLCSAFVFFSICLVHTPVTSQLSPMSTWSSWTHHHIVFKVCQDLHLFITWLFLTFVVILPVVVACKHIPLQIHLQYYTSIMKMQPKLFSHRTRSKGSRSPSASHSSFICFLYNLSFTVTGILQSSFKGIHKVESDS